MATPHVVVRREHVGTYYLYPGSEYVVVTFMWSTEHGECAECGRPAAFYATDAYGPGKDMKCCALCAANQAADGEPIRRITDDTDVESICDKRLPDGSPCEWGYVSPDAASAADAVLDHERSAHLTEKED